MWLARPWLLTCGQRAEALSRGRGLQAALEIPGAPGEATIMGAVARDEQQPGEGTKPKCSRVQGDEGA